MSTTPFDPPKTDGGMLSKLFGNPKAVVMLGGTLVVIISVVLIAMKMSNPKDNIPGQAEVPRLVAATDRDSDPSKLPPSSPGYRKLIDQKNERGAEEAAGTANKSYLPTLVGLTTPEDAIAAEAARREQLAKAERDRAEAARNAPAPGQPPQAPVMRMTGSDSAYSKALGFFGEAQKGWDPSAVHTAVVFAPKPEAAPAPGTATNASNQPQSGAQGSAATSQPEQKILIRVGTIFYATNRLKISSDQTGPVLATVQGGPFNGAELSGAKTVENEYLVLKYTSMTTRDGKMYKINAFAINIKDVADFGETAQRSDINNHYFVRLVLPAAAAFISGFGQAAARSGTTQTIGVAGVSTTTGELSTRDQVKSALGTVGQSIAGELNKGQGRQPTITVDANTEFGIIFADSVLNPQPQALARAR